MPKNILTCVSTGKLAKQLLILLASYTVFLIGILGCYYFDNCDRAGFCAFIAISALICFFIYLIIMNVSTFKAIFLLREESIAFFKNFVCVSDSVCHPVFLMLVWWPVFINLVRL